MEIFKDINKNPNLALALGFFDGVHKGHKILIDEMVVYAKKNGLKTAVMTFSKNPISYFGFKAQNIMSIEQRAHELEKLGVNYLYELDFEKYKDMKADDYLSVLVENFSPKLIVAGFNHYFGKNKTAGSDFLIENSKKYGYECKIIPEIKFNGHTVSSSEVRKYILKADLDYANSLLGRSFSITNTVIKGDGVARSLGYPTANLLWQEDIVKLPYGVYLGSVETDNKKIPSIISWGVKPTFKTTKNEVLEAHIYNYDKDIYFKKIKVNFEKKLRDQIKFSSSDELKLQLKKDYLEFLSYINQF